MVHPKTYSKLGFTRAKGQGHNRQICAYKRELCLVLPCCLCLRAFPFSWIIMIPNVTYLMISYETEEVAVGGKHKENKGREDQGTGAQGKYYVTFCGANEAMRTLGITLSIICPSVHLPVTLCFS